MRKNILFCSIAFIVIVTFFISKKPSIANVPDLISANIEALAGGESSDGKRITCYNTLSGDQGAPMEDKTWCDDCKSRPASKWSNGSECIK